MVSMAPIKQWGDFVMDPNKGLTKTGLTNQTIRDEYAKTGLKCRTNIADDLDFGHKKVQQLLYFDRERYISDGGMVEDNHPRLFVFRRCRNIISALSKYGFKTEGEGVAKSLTSRVEQDFKDFADVVRYRAVSMKAYSNPDGKGESSTMEAVKRARNKVGNS